MEGPLVTGSSFQQVWNVWNVSVMLGCVCTAGEVCEVDDSVWVSEVGGV